MDVRRIESNVRDSVQTAGLTVAEYVYSEPRRLRLVVDTDRGVTMDDCIRATHATEEALRIAGYDPEDFTINVESPGADRKLTTEHDFERFRGKEVRVTLTSDLDGRRKVVGILGPVNAERIELTEQKRNVSIERSAVKEVRLYTSFGVRRR
jgi:ribosome maturation factor RimP